MAEFSEITRFRNVQYQEFLHFEISDIDSYHNSVLREWLEKRTQTQIAITNLGNHKHEIDVKLPVSIKMPNVDVGNDKFIDWLFTPSGSNVESPIEAFMKAKNELEKIKKHCMEICK